jgi:hypothetical protein
MNPLEHLITKFLFEELDLAADGGLGDKQLLSGAGKAPGLDNGLKHLQLS